MTHLEHHNYISKIPVIALCSKTTISYDCSVSLTVFPEYDVAALRNILYLFSFGRQSKFPSCTCVGSQVGQWWWCKKLAWQCPYSGRGTTGTCNQQQSTEEAREADGGREREKRDEERGQEDDRRKVNETERACERKIGQNEKGQRRSYKTRSSETIFLHIKWQLGLFFPCCTCTILAVTKPNTKGNNIDLHSYFSLEWLIVLY